MRNRLLVAALLMLSASGASGCDTNPISPEIPTTQTVTFASRLQEKGSAWRSFIVPSTGEVTLQLATVTQADVVMEVGIGTIAGTNCVLTHSIRTAANATSNSPHIKTTLGQATYCVKISDIGNLTTIVDFLIVIVTPV